MERSVKMTQYEFIAFTREKLKKTVDKSEYTQDSIATKIGVTRATYIDFENGSYILPPDKLQLLKDILGIEPEKETTEPSVSVLDVLQEMTPEELEEREQVINAGMQTFIEVGEALAEIRDRKGYKHQYGTFEEYCRQRWGLTARHCRNLIGASKVVTLAEQNGKSLSQTAAQHIAVLGPEQQIEFISKHDAEQMTAREVEQAVKEYKQKLIAAEERSSELLQENTELQSRPVATVIQEIIPADYEATKNELVELKAIHDNIAQKIESVGKTRQEITGEVILVAERINEFIKDVANAVFLVRTAETFGETESKELDTSLNLLEDWLCAMRDARVVDVEVVH